MEDEREKRRKYRKRRLTELTCRRAGSAPWASTKSRQSTLSPEREKRRGEKSGVRRGDRRGSRRGDRRGEGTGEEGCGSRKVREVRG